MFSTFVTPAPPGEPTSPPVISTINVEPVGNDHLISCTVLDVDSDLNQVQLFVNNNQNPEIRTIEGDVDWIVDNLSNGNEIRIVATDNFGHSTEQIRLFNN